MYPHAFVLSSAYQRKYAQFARYNRIDNFSIIAYIFLRVRIAMHDIQNNGCTGCTVRARIIRNDRELFNQIIVKLCMIDACNQNVHCRKHCFAGG